MSPPFALFRPFAAAHCAVTTVHRCALFTIGAASGQLLTVSGAPRSPASSISAGPDGEPLLLCIPERNKQIGCLLAPDGGRLFVAGDACAGDAVSVRFEAAGQGGQVRLLHPLHAGWQLAARAGTDVAFVHQDGGANGVFRLEPADGSAIPVALRAIGQEMAAAAGLPERWEPVLAALRSGALRPGLAEALLRCLPIDELQSLSDHLAVSRADMRLLRGALPEERWLGARLDALLAWRQARGAPPRPTARVAADETDDLPGANRFTAHRPSLGHALHALARRATQPRRMACVLASARNEGPYLLDWIAYHRAIGFDHIFFYTNDNDDGSDELLGLLARAGAATWLRNELDTQTLPQIRSYAHALSVLPDILDFRWTLIADLDEYFAFEPKRFNGVPDFLSWHDTRRASAIVLPWLLHVADPAEVWRDAPSIARFPRRETTINHHIKTIFRTNLFWNANAHHPEPAMGLPVSTRVETGEPHRPKAPENNPALPQNPTANQAWIAHYMFRSAPEALMKIMRGKGDRPRADRQADLASMIRPFIALSTRRPLVDDPRIAACAAGMAAEHARLRAIPGVQACDTAIKQNFARRMADACEFVRLPAPVGHEDWAAFRSILLRQSQNVLFDSRVA